jgi:hypothetical protein
MTDVLTSIQRILDKPDDEDCDGLLRDALRLSQHPDMEEDDQDTLYDCIWTLIGRYIESPEGEGEDAQILMTRLLWVVFPVLKPHAPRGSNERQDETIVTALMFALIRASASLPNFSGHSALPIYNADTLKRGRD